MSAWYVLSALGIYPVNPSNGIYVFGSPVVDEAAIDVGKGKKFQIIAKNNSAENIYIQRMTLNGKPYTKSYLLHADILKGGKLIMEMGRKPSMEWGIKTADRPYSDY
jgi:putative alpha-1,2-mannosidase